MQVLSHYGWNSFRQNNYNIQAIQGASAGRVISIKGFKYDLITERGEIETELSGRLLYSTEPEDLPKVGDWVLYLDYGSNGYIVDVLPRQNFLARKNPGNKIERQILAANIDYAFVVQGLDRDFNLMRLDRYLTQIIACGIAPIIVLNKVDLVSNAEEYREQVSKLQHHCPLYFCSTYNGVGMQSLMDEIKPGRTYILIGSSGVGKSSLLNFFLSNTRQPVAPTSDANSKGKHTTTSREMFLLSNGGLLIDTPGMREFGLTSEDNETNAFPLIDSLAAHCRYSDCTHLQDEGCAVKSALENGTLDTQVYQSYVKLIKEQRRFEIKAEDKKRIGKQFGKMSREASNHRKKFKY